MRARPAPTLGAYYRSAVRRLARARLSYGHGTHSPRDEAAYLILSALRLPLDALAPHARRKLGPRELQRLDALIERRIVQRLPAAYLTGEAWLDDVAFTVDPRVIVPRSHIAELLHARLAPWLRRPVRRVLDLCTGSGCLAVLAARAFPRARVDAADLSAAALEVARVNVRRHRLQSRIRVLRSDLFGALRGERYDLIVCNPPYVTSAAMRALPREYRHEPHVALAGGRTGLDVVGRILDESAAHLRSRGLLVCEIGANRRALERAYPALPFIWPMLAAGVGQVFALEREGCPGGRKGDGVADGIRTRNNRNHNPGLYR